MPGVFDLVTTGIPVRDVLNERWWNTVTQAARPKTQTLTKPNRANQPLPFLEAHAKNLTGADLSALALASHDSVIFSEASLVPPEIILEATHFDSPMAITREPIKAGGIGRVVVAGVTFATVDIEDEAHGYAFPQTGTNTLTSAHFGFARIQHKPSGTGQKKCVVEIEPRTILFGVLDAPDLTAGLATGVVSIWAGPPGNALVDTTYNATNVHLVHLHGGDKVSAGKQVAIQWLMGAWHITHAECEDEAQPIVLVSQTLTTSIEAS